MKACISQACVLNSNFKDDVTAFFKGGCSSMEVWLTKLEKHLETNSVAETKAFISDHNMTLAAGSYQGGLFLSSGEQKKSHYDHFKRRLDLCQGLGIPMMNICSDFPARVDQQILQKALAGLREAAQWAEAFNTKLSFEFRASSSFANNLESAHAFVSASGMDNVGLTLDTFHFHCGPSKLADIASINPKKLFFVQVSDISAVPKELATDSDRIFPGDGDIDISSLIKELKKIGYDGHVSLELLNPVISQSKPAQVAELGMGSLQKILT